MQRNIGQTRTPEIQNTIYKTVFCISGVRAGRIELPTPPWQGGILPLNHARIIKNNSSIS